MGYKQKSYNIELLEFIIAVLVITMNTTVLAVINELLNKDNCVISLGGGSIINKRVRKGSNESPVFRK